MSIALVASNLYWFRRASNAVSILLAVSQVMICTLFGRKTHTHTPGNISSLEEGARAWWSHWWKARENATSTPKADSGVV